MSHVGTEIGGRYDRVFLTELYHIFLNREPDPDGFAHHLRALASGTPPHELVATFIKSEEFSRNRVPPAADLPDLRSDHSDYYDRDCYLALDNDRINFMEQLIHNHGYYDRFGVWSSSIDRDKLNLAELVVATGARSCLEVGCFNGPILSVLHDRGLHVTGIDLSHLAFVVAFPNIRRHLLYGNILNVKLTERYECILLLDILEHVNPLQLTQHIQRLQQLLSPNGVIILNSPMFGDDPVFGTVFQQSYSEWREVGDTGFFRHWPCDSAGWPMHGHMVWASPNWWTLQFASHGLIRIRAIEEAIQRCLSGYFSWAPARRSIFCIAHDGSRIDEVAVIAAISSRNWD